MESSFGRYRLLARLGQGGMGEVWHATVDAPEGSTREVVVKRMLAHLSGDVELVRAFEREARLCRVLDHPNIVRMIEWGEVAGEHFLAMEYVAGINLLQLQRARRAGGIEAGGAASVIAAVCRALAYAHDAADEAGLPLRLVHRDVTPSNIMIARDGTVRLLDFGIAKALAEVTDSHTNTGTLKGKFGYMAPELVEGGNANHRSDQFSVGVVLHELLTGRRLFRGETDLQTLAKVRAAVVEPPSASNPAIDPELDGIVLRALARDPAARFPHCAAMAQELDAIALAARWDDQRTAALVREVLEVEARPITSLGIGSEQTASATLPKPAVQRAARKPSRRGWTAASLVAILGVASLIVAQRASRSPTGSHQPTAIPAPVPAAELPTPSLPAAPPERAAPAAVAAQASPRERAPVRAHRPSVKREPAAKPPAKGFTQGQVRAGKVLDPFSH